MVAEREHDMVMQSVVQDHGGSFYSAAISNPQVFGMYFTEHIRRAIEYAGDNVYPYGYGAQGAFLIMAAGWYGWWHDPETAETHTSVGTDTDNAIVFGLDADRLTTIHDLAVADGLIVVRCVRMDTNEVI